MGLPQDHTGINLEGFSPSSAVHSAFFFAGLLVVFKDHFPTSAGIWAEYPILLEASAVPCPWLWSGFGLGT